MCSLSVAPEEGKDAIGLNIGNNMCSTWYIIGLRDQPICDITIDQSESIGYFKTEYNAINFLKNFKLLTLKSKKS